MSKCKLFYKVGDKGNDKDFMFHISILGFTDNFHSYLPQGFSLNRDSELPDYVVYVNIAVGVYGSIVTHSTQAVHLMRYPRKFTLKYSPGLLNILVLL